MNLFERQYCKTNYFCQFSAKTKTNERLRFYKQRRAEADERQRLSVLRKPLTRELEKVEKRMATLQADKTAIDAFMADSASYEDANKTRLMEMLKRQGEVTSELDQLEERWLELQEQIEQIA